MTTTRRKLSLSDPTLYRKSVENVKEWIEGVTHEKIPTDKPLHDILADGTILCTLINCLKPNTIKRFHYAPKIAALKLENAGFFLKACKTPFLVPDSYIPAPQDLGESIKFVKVVMLLLMLMHKSGFALSEEFRSVSQEGEGDPNIVITGEGIPSNTLSPAVVPEGDASPARVRQITPSRSQKNMTVNPPPTDPSAAVSLQTPLPTAPNPTAQATDVNTNSANSASPVKNIPTKPTPVGATTTNPSTPPSPPHQSTIDKISMLPQASSKPTIASIRTSMSSPGISGRTSSFQRKPPSSPYGQSSSGDAISTSPSTSAFSPLAISKAKAATSMFTPKLDPASVLRSFFKGDVITPSQSDYETCRSVHNRMYNQLPHMIVQPKCANDVATALKFASSNGMKVSIKSRGYGAACGTTLTNTLLIDLSRHMTGIFVDKKYKTVTVQPGARWIDVQRAVAPFVVAGPHDGNLGIGTVLQGGFGPLLNSHGLSMDTVISFDVVTASGELRVATTTENEELFWALKGAGSLSYGVVTSCTLEIFDNVPNEMYTKTRVWPLDAAGNVLKQWAKLFAEQNFERALISRITLAKEGLVMENLFLGDHDQGESACKFFDVANIKTTQSQVRSVSFLEWNEEKLSQDEANKYIIKSGLLPKLDDDTVDTMTSLTESCPDGGSFRFEVEFLFGAVTDLSTIYTSFPHRLKSVHVMSMAMFRVNDEEWRMWSDAFGDTIGTKRSGIPVNYADQSLGEFDYQMLYWGENYGLLQEIKASYDSANLFSHPQGVRPFGE